MPKTNVQLEDDLEELEPSPCEALLDQVAEDASERPEAYLKETIVPKGGE